MIFLSLRVTADAEGGLKNRAHHARFYRGLGAVSHQQASLGIYRGIACRYLHPCRPAPFFSLHYRGRGTIL